MAKICELHIPHKYRLAGSVIERGMELRKAEGRRQNEEAGARLMLEAGVAGLGLKAKISHTEVAEVTEVQGANIQCTIPQCPPPYYYGATGRDGIQPRRVLRVNPT